MICYPSQSHYPDIEPTSPFPVLIIPSTRLGSDKYQSSHRFDLTRVRNREVQIRTRDSQILRSPRTEGRCSTHSATLTSQKLSNRYSCIELGSPTRVAKTLGFVQSIAPSDHMLMIYESYLGRDQCRYCPVKRRSL